MNDSTLHLTEDERQTLADGSMPAERAQMLDAHLRSCETCAADVARIKALMTRIYDTPAPVSGAPLDELWPSIRSRIEQSKVIPLAAPAAAAERKRSITARHFPWIAGIVAAAVIGALMFRPSHKIPTIELPRTGDSHDSGATLINVVDSVASYENEARTLLNKLELQRSMLRPEAAAALDHDLRTIDQAIDELKVAIANDPRNPALRQLLASSYRQKVELLKRANQSG